MALTRAELTAPRRVVHSAVRLVSLTAVASVASRAALSAVASVAERVAQLVDAWAV